MTPTINVNLQQCRAPCPGGTEHHQLCPGVPVPIPCRLPGSFTCTAVLGECTGDGCYRVTHMGRSSRPFHEGSCPARPIKVSCSITSKDGTWEASEVDPESIEVRGYGFDQLGAVDGLAVCRARWELVKALVLGYTAWDYTMSHAVAVPWARITSMLAQRDAVFSALADMAREEEAAWTAQCHARDAIPKGARWIGPLHHAAPVDRPSAALLAAYVTHLIEQVGVLGMLDATFPSHGEPS